jgi:TRAP-type mannitol/chloroaromatic compound transport system permease small subunit
MTEDQERKLLDELNLYRNLIAEAEKKSKRWDVILADWLGKFVAYALIIMVLWVCWNYSLVKLWPIIPETSPLQMAGLWYLVVVLLKRD